MLLEETRRFNLEWAVERSATVSSRLKKFACLPKNARRECTHNTVVLYRVVIISRLAGSGSAAIHHTEFMMLAREKTHFSPTRWQLSPLHVAIGLTCLYLGRLSAYVVHMISGP